MRRDELYKDRIKRLETTYNAILEAGISPDLLERELGLIREMVEALKASSDALAPEGHFKYRAERNVAIGDAYNKLKTVLAKLEVQK